MKSILAAIVVVIIILFGAWWYFSSTMQQPSTQTIPPSHTSTIIPDVPDATYRNAQLNFSLRYPSSATTSQVQFEGYLPLTQTSVASFVLPRSMFNDTNLSEAGVYIGATTSPRIVAACTKASPDMGEVAMSTETIGGTDFSVFASNDAGAGNFYESKTYRTVQNATCLEIVELLHSGNIANFPTGTVTEFDHAKFSGILDAIVHTYQPSAGI